MSGLFNQASLVLVPSGYKSGKVYSEVPTDGDGDLTFTRASSATRVNSDGEIEVVGSGVPRLDYSQGSCPALLLEPQRTNLVLYSEEFDNAAYLKLNSASVTPNTITSPDGSTNADTINISSSFASRLQQGGISITSNTTYTMSCFFKNIALISGETFVMRVENTNAPPNNLIAIATIDLANLSSTYSLTGTSGTGFSGTASGTIVDFGNGWYRFSLTFATGTAGGSANTNIQIRNDSGARSFYIWGAQVEAGSYATSYIPTTSATVTRLRDSFTRNNIYTNGLITSSGGTWFVELKNNVSYTRDSGGFGIALANNNTSYDFGFLILTNSGSFFRISILKRVSGIGTSIYTTTTDTTKIVIKWNGSTADIFANGTKVVTATSFTTTQMELLTANILDTPKYIQNMQLYPTPLSDSDCISLTTL
jgi:hypothetical protein